MSTVKKGKEGEKLAADYLQEHGYEVIEQNYRFKRGEIDIIAKTNNVLVFVEVKYKSSTKFGFPEEAVNSKKEEMVLNTADQYIYKTGWKGLIRFDIISILSSQGGIKLEHFKDAFY